MKALTVQQPWAWAIMHGGKLIENRTQNWNYRGPLAIHAGQRISERGTTDSRVTVAAAEWVSGLTGVPAETIDMVGGFHICGNRGVILGTVELVDVHPDAGCCKPWGESAYVEHGGRERRRITHLVLENPQPLAEPIPAKGALGLWTPTADVLEQLATHREVAW